MLAWLVAPLVWISGLVGTVWTATLALFSGLVIANVVADFIGRIIRIGIVVGVTVAIINSISIPATSLTGLWTSYSSQAGSALAMVGYFVPISLLFTLIDLYLAAILVVLAIRAVRYIKEAGQ